MSSFSPKFLFQQVAGELLRRIGAGDLHGTLPGEEVLAPQLGVSRPVLRQALEELERQGIVSIAKGKRTRILRLAPALPGQPAERRRLLVLGPIPASAAPEPEQPRTVVLNLLESHLEKNGWQWEEHFGKALGSARGRARLRQLWRESRADVVLLVGSTAEMQAWAMAEEIPALVLGSLAEGSTLPSVDVHYYALGWHAGGRFAAAGRRRITVFTRRPLRMGDRATLRGLRDFAATLPGALEVVEAEARPPFSSSLVPQFEGVLKLPAAHGWLFLFPADAVTAYTHLLASGRRFPGEVALISREAFPWIGAMSPSLAHYRANHRLLVRRSAAILGKLALGVATGLKGAAIMPRFIPGETLVPSEPFKA